ncbi:hypothetical protein NQ314_004539 [Rhamnusium bicolor]|uniref:C2H2-type domain-containing protein n=1 Tax=Rhamnusium bicolor TaxID=1586634 RepID=A0AAV8ZJM5_9CUCU|nr:hypothetical protein NQ314_004539 [Rhamnusium bicolor]
MASNSGVQEQSQQQQQQQQQHFLQQQTNSPYHCKECGISLNSAESLDVHLQYHKENLLKHWAIQAASSHSEETNNNTTKANIKRELIPINTIAAADSSDSMQKKSPEYSRATPDHIFGHPPTPQSYQSASSPYQNHDNSAFSPNFQNNYHLVKIEKMSPNSQQQAPFQQNNFSNFSDPQYFAVESSQGQQYSDSYGQKTPISAYRYHRYSQPQLSPYERPQAPVSSSSPAYPPQPTPSPSPKQCDKCGYVCESASQLIEHLNMAHPPTPAPHLSAYQPNQHFMFDQSIIKQEDNVQSEILDLDSHKVVHNVYPEEEKRQNGDPNGPNPHSVSAMLTWPPPNQQQPSQQQQQKLFQQQQEQHRMFEQKLFPQNIPDNIPENKMFSPDQKLFQPHQIHNQDFMVNGVTSTQENSGNGMNSLSQPPQAYRPFEHLPSPPVPVTSTQVPNNPAQPAPSGMQKSSNWKSNEARRPKTYNCTACNKWFTSSGHLKRHYNTTLHKNAVKSSGQPDPASLPISAHHHPARESSSKQEDRPQSGSSGDEIRNEDNNSMPPQFERINSMPGLLQQPPNGPYDRQPAPNIHHTPPLHSPMPHSPMTQHHSPLGNHIVNPNLSNGSPPNGEAGLSTNNLDSRGLLSLSSHPINTANTPHGYNMAPQHMMSMENNQFQMYPNESAPHVTQAMATNNLNTTGEFDFTNQNSLVEENQPLPSFAQIHAHRYGLIGYEIANVGGGGAVTTPYTYYMESNQVTDSRAMMYRTEDEYKLTILTAADPAPIQDDYMLQYSPNHNNNNNHSDDLSVLSISSENETHIPEETEHQLIHAIKK